MATVACIMAVVLGLVTLAFAVAQCVAFLILDGVWRCVALVPGLVVALAASQIFLDLEPRPGWLWEIAGWSLGALLILLCLIYARSRAERDTSDAEAGTSE